MTTQWRLVAFSLVGAAACGLTPRATAMELLNLGNFEADTGAQVPSWTLEEFRTADPSLLVDSAALAGFADNPIDPLAIDPLHRGLWIRPFSGSVAGGTTEAILSQIVPAVPGEEYRFTGDGLFEANYGGTAGFSTDINFELAFLDSNGMVIGSPVVRDLETELIAGLGWSGRDGNPEITPLVGVAPANAASVRVRAQGNNMTSNTTNSGAQSAFVDNFSLTTTTAPSTELLANANLNIIPPTVEELLVAGGWNFIESPDTSTDILRIAGFANNPATGGSSGIWISPFLASAQGGSGMVAQTVAGTAGTEYAFSASARWETNFFGDTGVADENMAVIELAFLDEAGEVIEAAVLDLRDDGKTADNNWSTHSVSATAPAGTVDVRVAGIISNLTTNPAGGGQSAFWDDFSLMVATTPSIPGDFDGDGDVDISDFGIFADNFGLTGQPLDPPVDGDFEPDGDVDISDFGVFADNFGTGVGAVVAVPEPGSALLVLAGMALAATRRRV